MLVSRFFEHAHQMQTWQAHAAKSEARNPFRWKCSEVSHFSLVKARAVSAVLSTSSFEPWGGWSLLRALSVSSHHHSSLLRGYRSMKLPIANLSKLHVRRLSVRGVVPCRMPCSRAWRARSSHYQRRQRCELPPMPNDEKMDLMPRGFVIGFSFA